VIKSVQRKNQRLVDIRNFQLKVKFSNLHKRICYIVILSFVLFVDSQCQDPTFSQFYANPLYLAPSFAGATEEYRLGMNYRNQWPAVPGVFHTYSISLIKLFPILIPE